MNANRDRVKLILIGQRVRNIFYNAASGCCMLALVNISRLLKKMRFGEHLVTSRLRILKKSI